MHIVHIASELAPIAKTGGLGDAVYGLCKELVRQGHRVQILLPKYDTIPYSRLTDLLVYQRDLWSYDGPNRYHNTVRSAQIDGLEILLVEAHHPGYPFERGMIYGCIDDTERFLYFSRTCMEFLFKHEQKPDAVHLHDWPTAVIPALQKQMYEPLGLSKIRMVLTLHNPEHQGKCSVEQLSRTGLDGPRNLASGEFRDPGNGELINLLKGGILYADSITTVSPSYKKEILTPESSFGLHETLLAREKNLHGILNGIDKEAWNPETDEYIKTPFSGSPPFTKTKRSGIKKGKAAAKKELQTLLGLSPSTAPLFGCISRLVRQKGPRLIAHAFEYILAKGGQCVILGSIHSEEMRGPFSDLQSKYANHTEGKILLEYDERLSRLIYAGSDLLLVPSLFEPCGLTQMIAFRYGSVPIVRKTGGLADTVSQENGFLFEAPTEEALSRAIDEAYGLFTDEPKRFEKIRESGMSRDSGWSVSAKQYVDLYCGP